MTTTMMVTMVYRFIAYVASLMLSNVNKLLHLNLITTTWDSYDSMHPLKHEKMEACKGQFA